MVEEVTVLRGLYVEDNAQDADLTRRALLRHTPAIEIDVVDTVADALARLNQPHHGYQWVLFDLTLPDGDGLQVLRHIRQHKLPLAAVAVTGTGDERAVAQALKMGVDDYVIKQGDYLAQLPAILLGARARQQREASRLSQSLRVLYIEDNPHDGELTSRHMAQHAPHVHMEVLSAPMPALNERLRLGDYDVLLLDYRLEELDAFEIIRQIRRGPMPDVPIVVVTGHGAEDTAVQALRMGVSDYIVKDSNHIQQLPAVLESAHSRAQLMRERERLRQSEAQLLQLTRQVPGVFVVSRWHSDGTLVPEFTSDGMQSVMGLSMHDLKSGAMRERMHPEDRGRIRMAVTQAVQQMGVAVCEYRFDCPPRGWRWFETQMSPERQADGTVLLYTYTFDITERKQFAEVSLAAEAAQRANHAKTEFLSRMSHELRTPLNAVLGFAQLLQSDSSEKISETQRKQVRFIEQAGAHLVEMINEVLDLSRIESGHITLAISPIDAVQSCHDALSLVTSAASKSGVVLHVEPPAPGVQPLVLADPLRLRQILVNLLSNAIKYNRRGGRVTVDVRPDKGSVLLQVSDNGPGLSPEQQAHLFEPFNRLGAERSSVEGTGIGLVIVRKLIELMGGELSVHSEPGVGSQFTVRLHAAPATAAPAPTPEIPKPPASTAKQVATVLYVEDDAVNIELMRQILGIRLGLQLEVATSGEQAISMALANPPDLLLLDMQLGDMDGIAVSDALRDDPRVRDIPRIGLSADALPERIRRATAHGFADYLTKPVDVLKFIACLERHLPQKRAEP